MTAEWKTVCSTDDLVVNSGICALINGQQIAIFQTKEGQSKHLYALSNWDPIGGANVLYRGLLGSAEKQIFVASPLYKQRFDVLTGQCLDDDDVCLKTFEVRAIDEQVQIKVVN